MASLQESHVYLLLSAEIRALRVSTSVSQVPCLISCWALGINSESCESGLTGVTCRRFSSLCRTIMSSRHLINVREAAY